MAARFSPQDSGRFFDSTAYGGKQIPVPGRSKRRRTNCGKSSGNQSAFFSVSAASPDFAVAVGENGIECSGGDGFAGVCRNGAWHSAHAPMVHPRGSGPGPGCGGGAGPLADRGGGARGR